jgi:hypothetical protein
MPNRRLRIAALLLTGILAAACGTGGSSPSLLPGESGGPSGSPPTSDGAIAHPGGAADIVLRYDVGGGLVPISFFAAHLPSFTLYGDGTTVWVSAVRVNPRTDGAPSTGQPLRTGRLPEDQVQALLAFALGDGGLGAARDSYDFPGIADGPTTTFRIDAGGRSRTISVYALGIEGQGGPDIAIRTHFKALVTRLAEIDANGTAGVPYVATAYRGVLDEASGSITAPVAAWPWTTIAPADFLASTGDHAMGQRRKVLSPGEAAALGVPGYRDGITGGLYLEAPDGRTYSLVLRPLLPDEAS